jgi:hypothetical protein
MVPAFLPLESKPVSDTLPISPRTNAKLLLTVEPASVEPVASASVEPPTPLPNVVFGNERLRPAFEPVGLVVMVPLNFSQPRPAVARAVVAGSSVKVLVVASGCPTAILAGAVATS